MVAIEIRGPSEVLVNSADGTVAISCQNNLQDMVRSITGQTAMNSIDVLRITAPGIIAILVGLLLPATNKASGAAAQSSGRKAGSALSRVREAAGHNVVSSNAQTALANQWEEIPYLEQGLKILRPYLAHGARVELRTQNVSLGKLNSDGLTKLAKTLGAAVLIGAAAPNSAGWQGPVITATPDGKILRG